jgi:hypothetical protein
MPRPVKFRRLQSVLMWAGAFLPAVFVLLYLWPRVSRVPYHDSWAFAEQYRNWCEGHYSWREFFAPHNNHPSAVGKAVYFAVMHGLRGDMSLLSLVTWGLALVVSLGVLALSRPLWRDAPGRGAALMFLVNLSVFTLAQGHTWIWDFVFQNAIPGACLTTGLWALSVTDAGRWRWLLAACSGVVATFSFGTGAAVGFLLLPSVWLASGGRTWMRRCQTTAAWAAAAALTGWLALKYCVAPGVSVGHPDGMGRAGDLLSRPWDALCYVLALLGHTLGQGTVFEPVVLCAIWGGILSVLFAALSWTVLRNRDAARLRRAWPWMAMFFWALLNAAAICVGRLRVSLDTALAPRYGAFTLFAVVGVVLLALEVAQDGDGGVVGRCARRMLGPGAALLIAFHLISWGAGADTLELYVRRMSSERAALVFADALPLSEDALWQLDHADGTVKLARFLKQRDRLRDVSFVADAALSRWRLSPEVSDKWSHWELLRGSGGTWEMQGVCGLSKDLVSMPDLVLVTATPPGEAERIIALVPPLLPDDFFDRELLRRQYHSHYFSWSWPVAREALPGTGDVILRAYAFDADQRKVRRIRGEARCVTDPQ